VSPFTGDESKDERMNAIDVLQPKSALLAAPQSAAVLTVPTGPGLNPRRLPLPAGRIFLQIAETLQAKLA